MPPLSQLLGAMPARVAANCSKEPQVPPGWPVPPPAPRASDKFEGQYQDVDLNNHLLDIDNPNSIAIAKNAAKQTNKQYQGNLPMPPEAVTEIKPEPALVSAGAAVKAAIADQSHGAMESRWTSNLAAILCPLAQSNAKLCNMLYAFGWTGTQFQTPPNLNDLLSVLEEQTRVSHQASNQRVASPSELSAAPPILKHPQQAPICSVSPVFEYWVNDTICLPPLRKPLKVWGQQGGKLYEGSDTSLFLFQDGSVRTRYDKEGVVATIRCYGGVPFIQVDDTYPYNEVLLCLEDISAQLPLQNGMKLRLVDFKEGPEFQVSLNQSSGADLQMMTQSQKWLFKKDFEVGRGTSKTTGLERCPVQNKYVSSKGHGAFRRRDGKWYLERHPASAEVDETRQRSTWLVLSPKKSYLLPAGARDSKIAVWAIGREGKALFAIETGGLPLPCNSTEPEVTAMHPAHAANF